MSYTVYPQDTGDFIPSPTRPRSTLGGYVDYMQQQAPVAAQTSDYNRDYTSIIDNYLSQQQASSDTDIFKLLMSLAGYATGGSGGEDSAIAKANAGARLKELGIEGDIASQLAGLTSQDIGAKADLINSQGVINARMLGEAGDAAKYQYGLDRTNATNDLSAQGATTSEMARQTLGTTGEGSQGWAPATLGSLHTQLNEALGSLYNQGQLAAQQQGYDLGSLYRQGQQQSLQQSLDEAQRQYQIFTAQQTLNAPEK